MIKEKHRTGLVPAGGSIRGLRAACKRAVLGPPPPRQDPVTNADGPRNNERTRRLRRSMRPLLLRWDPIGVQGVPEAEDEYDCLISPLLHLLEGGAGAGELQEFLGHERATHFELSPQPHDDALLAEALVAWWAGGTRRP